MSMNLVVLLYLVASVFLIQSLKGLAHPKARGAQLVWYDRHGHRRGHHCCLDLETQARSKRVVMGAGRRFGWWCHWRSHGAARRDGQDAELVAFMHSMIGWPLS